MNNFIKRLCCLMVALVLAVTLVGCKEDDHVHQYGKWVSNETSHFHSCSGCGGTELASHEWVDGDVTKPTCSKEGSLVHKCAVCGYETSEPIAKVAHTLTKVEKVDPTCTVTGCEEHYECSVCNKLFADAEGKNEVTAATLVIETAPHTLTKVDEVEATCETAGCKEHYKCSVCEKLFEDEEGKTETTQEELVIEKKAHTLTKHDAVEATLTQTGNGEYYDCSECNKYFADAEGKEEIEEGSWALDQLVATVEQAKEAKVGEQIIVRGIFEGVASTSASAKLITMILVKDEVSNETIPVSGACFADKLVSSTDVSLVYEKGTIVEIPVTTTLSEYSYPNGQASIKYFVVSDAEADYADFVKGKVADYKYSKDDIPTLTTQEDLFKFLGSSDGTNNVNNPGYTYSNDVKAANAFKYVKLNAGIIYGLAYASSSVVYESQYYRFFFDSAINSVAKQCVLAKGNAGAKQNYSPVFRNNYTYANTGKTFSELVFGINSLVATSTSGNNPLVFNGDIYCMFVGGNDYYLNFVILDEADVVPCDHKAGSEYGKDAENHWTISACDHAFLGEKEEHKFGEQVVDTPATEEAAGKAHKTCTVCDYVWEYEITLCKHTFSEDYEHDETTHWNPATCEHTDVRGNEEDHSYGAEVLDLTDGKYYHTCTVCQYKEVSKDTSVAYYVNNADAMDKKAAVIVGVVMTYDTPGTTTISYKGLVIKDLATDDIMTTRGQTGTYPVFKYGTGEEAKDIKVGDILVFTGTFYKSLGNSVNIDGWGKCSAASLANRYGIFAVSADIEKVGTTTDSQYSDAALEKATLVDADNIQTVFANIKSYQLFHVVATDEKPLYIFLNSSNNYQLCYENKASVQRFASSCDGGNTVNRAMQFASANGEYADACCADDGASLANVSKVLKMDAPMAASSVVKFTGEFYFVINAVYGTTAGGTGTTYGLLVRTDKINLTYPQA